MPLHSHGLAVRQNHTAFTLFCFLPGYVSIKSSLPEPQRMRWRGKKRQGCQWNPSWIRWHKSHIQQIKFIFWKGTAERLVDFKMSYNSCVLVGQQQLLHWLGLARLCEQVRLLKYSVQQSHPWSTWQRCLLLCVSLLWLNVVTKQSGVIMWGAHDNRVSDNPMVLSLVQSKRYHLLAKSTVFFVSKVPFG